MSQQSSPNPVPAMLIALASLPIGVSLACCLSSPVPDRGSEAPKMAPGTAPAPAPAPAPPVSAWEWSEEEGDAYAPSAYYASFSAVSWAGVRQPMDLVRTSRVEVGCVAGRPAVMLSLAPFPNWASVEISRDGSTWAHPKLRKHGPFGSAYYKSEGFDGYVYPGLPDVKGFVASLATKPRLYVRWRVEDGSDDVTYLAVWNLSRWEEVAGRAAQKCDGWPDPWWEGL